MDANEIKNAVKVLTALARVDVSRDRLMTGGKRVVGKAEACWCDLDSASCACSEELCGTGDRCCFACDAKQTRDLSEGV